MKAVLRCDLSEGGRRWDIRLLSRSVCGLPLLKRHLLGLREAGFERVEIRAFDDDREIVPILAKCQVAGVETPLAAACPDGAGEEPALEQRADTLIDPRLLQQLVRKRGQAADSPWRGAVRFVDRHRDNYAIEAKSPYRVGVPEKDEAALPAADAGALYPIGLEVKAPSQEAAAIDVGRFYWHRIQSREELPEATRKVLLATMKKTDGIYARTNRRVSLVISRLLAPTPVTPNMVTLFTLVCSLLAGLLYAEGSYVFMVAGGFVSWAASMLDGVDGELARSKFQTSDFGCWLEMVCDYLYYVFVFTGLGYGLSRSSGHEIWFYMGAASAVGSLIGFAVVAHQRKLYSSRADAGEYGLAFQQKVGARAKTDPIYAATRKLTFLATRAAAPYYIFIFTALGLAKGLLVLIFVGTVLACAFAGYVTRLFTAAPAD